MSIRNTVLVIDHEGDISNQISEELREQGYHTICVGETGSFLPLLDSRDRIYTIVLVDQDLTAKIRRTHIKALKQLGAGVPFVFTTAMNESRKEKEVRENGVFFYHVESDGMKVLVKAVRAAVEDAISKDKFIPSLNNQ